MKILISAFEKQFFQGKEWLFKDVDFNEMWRNEIENNNEKMTSRSGDTITHKIVFTANGLRNHPPASELMIKISL